MRGRNIRMNIINNHSSSTIILAMYNVTNNEEWMEEPDGFTGEKGYKISVVADDVRVSDRNMDHRGGTHYRNPVPELS